MTVANRYFGVIIKTVERCNINCTYCYFFNMGEESYKRHPIYIPWQNIKAIVQFLKEGVTALNIDTLAVEFHGGEPLMQKREQFDKMCELITCELSPLVKLELGLQTNGMLINNEWIELFIKYKVGVGISLDGPKKYHDRYRLDHRGQGTYERVAEKIAFIQNHPKAHQFEGIGILSVINPAFNAREIYHHFVHNLNLDAIDFLLPDFSHGDKLPAAPEQYGEFLISLFDAWTLDDNPRIDIRFLNSTLGAFYGKTSRIYGVGPMMPDELPLITISSAGDLSPTDELRTSCPEVMYNGSTVHNKRLADFLADEPFEKLRYAQNTLSAECLNCPWLNVCGGGGLIHRYDRKSKTFSNPSIYCSGLKMFYAHVATYLLRHGYCKDKLLAFLSDRSLLLKGDSSSKESELPLHGNIKNIDQYLNF